jgi:glycosyltransferase involved in cell wall biosynthesis
MHPSIVLNMIVRNESKIIKRMLESVYPFITTFVILDTGSTDDTVEIINQFAADHPLTMPGRVFYAPEMYCGEENFNFKDSRNYALMLCAGLCDYILFMDADMIIDPHMTPDWLFETLRVNHDIENPPAYRVIQDSNGFYNFNTRLVPNIVKDIVGKKMRYYTFTHEYISLPPNYKTVFISHDDFYINDVGDGGSKTNKYVRDIRLCSKGMMEDEDREQLQDRYSFYLANTYYYKGCEESAKAAAMDAGEDMANMAIVANHSLKEACRWYDVRIAIGKWDQEVWCSHYNKGKAYMKMIPPEKEKAVYCWCLAYEAYPHRIENLYELVRHFKSEYKQKLADMYYNMALFVMEESEICKTGRGQMLFLENNVYDYLLLYEHTIYAPYIGKKDLSREVVYLLNRVPDYIGNTIIRNLKFYNTCIEMSPGLKLPTEISAENMGLHRLMLPFVEAPFVTSSASFYKTGRGDYKVNVRLVNYTIDKSNGKYTLHTVNGIENKIITRNVELLVDSGTFEVKEWKEKEFKIVGIVDGFETQYMGIEDVKLFPMPTLTDGGDLTTEPLFMGTTKLCTTGRIGMVFGKYNEPESTREVIAPFAPNVECEKNWVFVGLCRDSLEQELEPYIIYKWADENGDLLLCELLEHCSMITPTSDVVTEDVVGVTEVVEDVATDVATEDVATEDVATEDVAEEDVATEEVVILNPTMMINIVERIKMPRMFKYVRGSTNGVPFGDEIWFICHLVDYGCPRHYYHMFVVMNKKMQLLRYSAPFTFDKTPIEYCLGLDVTDEKVTIAYSKWDSSTTFVSYHKTYVDSLLAAA